MAMHRHRRVTTSLRLLYSAATFASLPEYDIVHGQVGGLGLDALALRDAGVEKGRLVLSFRGADVTRNGCLEAYHRLFQECDLALLVCEAFRGRLEAAGCPPQK